jgi:hypothetical protein
MAGGAILIDDRRDVPAESNGFHVFFSALRGLEKQREQ